MTIKTGVTYSILRGMSLEAEAKRRNALEIIYTVWDVLTVDNLVFTVSVTRFKGLRKPIYFFQDAHGRAATLDALEAATIYAEAIEWAFS